MIIINDNVKLNNKTENVISDLKIKLRNILKFSFFEFKKPLSVILIYLIKI